MRHRALYIPLPVLAVFCILATGSCTTVSPPRTSGAATSESLSMTATCRAVDSQARTLDVVTGVGMALRLVRFRMSPECRIKAAAGVPVEAGNLKPGEIIRIRYQEKPDHKLAESIEALPAEAGGGAR